MAVANSIKEIRRKHHINQDDLAFAVGSCGRTIGRIERGERNASLELALRIAKYFELSVEELFSLEDLSK